MSEATAPPLQLRVVGDRLKSGRVAELSLVEVGMVHVVDPGRVSEDRLCLFVFPRSLSCLDTGENTKEDRLWGG